jgi:alpha-tubulin suppressor-like RCC1 family protein
MTSHAHAWSAALWLLISATACEIQVVNQENLATALNPPAAVAVVQGREVVRLVTFGFGHCVLFDDETAACWGSNDQGNLGTGSFVARSLPTPIVDSGGQNTLSGITGFSGGAGYEHKCALLRGGGISCWGYNLNGQLGRGAVDPDRSAVPSSPLDSSSQPFADVSQAVTGVGYTCVLRTNGEVWCWGYNGYGNLGDGTTTNRLTPVRVQGLSGTITQLTSGRYHVCVLLSDATARCWGCNINGQLGNNATVNGQTSPVTVLTDSSGAPLGGISALVAGGMGTCALLSDRTIRCWGSNTYGELGNGTTSASATPLPVAVTGITDAVSLSVSPNSLACAVHADATASCWGLNIHGRLGNNTTTNSSIPVKVLSSPGVPLQGIAEIAPGNFSNCARLTERRKVYCWGQSAYGRLGFGYPVVAARAAPVRDSSDTPIGQVTAVGGYSQSGCAVVAGEVKCWGINATGMLGLDTTATALSFYPLRITGTSGATQVSAGNGSACAVIAGAAKCWGDNSFNQLGDGTTTASVVPVQVSGLTSGVLATAKSSYTSCALLDTGALKCWGLGSSGENGDGTNTSVRSTPVQVSGLTSGVTAVAGNYLTFCAAHSGAAKCWGYNGYGQLGDGTTTNRNSPVQVQGLTSGVTSVAVGLSFSCAVANGAAYCWGSNALGYLGDGAPLYYAELKSTTPVAVSGLSSGVTAVAASYYNACALLSSGQVRCWGMGNSGQLGNGEAANSSTPVTVIDESGAALSGVTQIAAFGWTSCALLSDQTVKCWGSHYANLGNNRPLTVNPNLPVAVSLPL